MPLTHLHGPFPPLTCHTHLHRVGVGCACAFIQESGIPGTIDEEWMWSLPLPNTVPSNVVVTVARHFEHKHLPGTVPFLLLFRRRDNTSITSRLVKCGKLPT